MRIIIKHIRHTKQTVLLLSMFLTSNIYSMVPMVARASNLATCRRTCLFLQKKLSGGKYTRMLSTDSTKQDGEKRAEDYNNPRQWPVQT